MKLKWKQIIFPVFLFGILLIYLTSCKSGDTTTVQDIYASAEGFDPEGSDSLAVELANKVLLAVGGRTAWDNTEYIKWNFFGSRRHVWNKTTNDVVIEGLRDSFIIKMNLDRMDGYVNLNGTELSKSDSLDKYLQRGKEMWINDSYWLLMPFKLKDPGVSLQYLGSDTTRNGNLAEKIELTFDNVGVTPDNKYHIYIDPIKNLVLQWDYFTNNQDTLPRFSSPWEQYRIYGNLLLSESRGPNRLISEISVSDSLAAYFTSNE